MSNRILPQSTQYNVPPSGDPVCLHCQQPLTGEPVSIWYCSETCKVAYEAELLAKLSPLPDTDIDLHWRRRRKPNPDAERDAQDAALRDRDRDVTGYYALPYEGDLP